MDLKEIKTLIDLMKKNDLSVFKMEKEGFKITLKKGNDFEPIYAPSGYAPAPAATAATVPTTSAAPAVKETVPGKEITSPMVGTFYEAASPESGPYIQVGQEVTAETVVCIIEAMKVMNEIKSEVSGIVTEIVAENGKPVQFGQVLFKVK